MATKRGAQTRRERVEERERAIIAAAGEVLAKRGLDKSTMSEIARRAGVAEGTVYLYFENKAALMRSVQASFYERLTERATTGVTGIADTRARLEFLARLHLQSLLQQWRTVMVVLASYRDVADYIERNEQYEFNRTYVAVFDDVVRQGIARGELRDDVPLWLMRDIFYGTLEYAVRTMLIHDWKDDVERTVESLMEVLLRGVAKGEPARRSAKIDPVGTAIDRLERVAERLEASSARRPPVTSNRRRR